VAECDRDPDNSPGAASPHPELAQLRGRAEQRARALESEEIDTWPAEARRVLHELRVHQVELEMQNEQLRATRDELEASRARYFDLYDLAPVGYCTVSAGGLVLRANLTAATLLGMDRSDLIKRRLSQFVIRQDNDVYYQYRKGRERGQPGTCELRMVKHGGGVFWARLEAANARDEDGTPVLRVVIIDITEQKRAQEIEKQLREAQKLESLGVLAGGIAHDFNNLVGSILTYSELAEQKLAGGCPADEEIRGIQKVAGRAGEIVLQMMAYVGRETAATESVDLSRLVGDMLELLHVSISKRAALKIDLQENLPAVLANPAQIRQVIMNLITNASEAIGERGGVITIATSRVGVEDGSASIGEPRQVGGVRLEVSDTGCGMTEEVRSKIFDPFFTTKFAGRGLGLAAVDGIIRSHGGTINVTSRRGRGSRFEVLLPCAREPVRHAGDAAIPAVKEARGFAGTILVVEDEETLRSVLSEMLRRTGCTVIEAGDGQTGIDRFRASASKIDVVLLDLTLPGMSGSEVLGELRRIRPDLKVILTSAYSQDWAQGLIGEQPSSFLRKPYHFSELMDLIRNVCPGR